MDPNLTPEPETTPLQERMDGDLEDNSRPAEQILREQGGERNPPAVFVP